MRSGTRIGTICALALLLGVGRGRAQTIPETGPQTAPQTIEDALHAMTQQAAVIFAGQVTAVRRLDGVNGATGVVEIDFAGDDAIRGISGSTYTVREWAGLWTTENQPLCAGRRYLMLLHAPSAAGLSSPIGGMDGAIPIRSGGQGAPVAEPASRLASAAAEANAGSVDLRWVATRVARSVSYAANSPVHPTALPAGVRANAIVAGTAREPEPASSLPGSDTAEAASPMAAASTAPGAAAPLTQNADYAAVLAWLRSWQKADHGPR